MWASGAMVGLAVRPTPWTSEPVGQGAARAPPIGRVQRIDASDVERAPAGATESNYCGGGVGNDSRAGVCHQTSLPGWGGREPGHVSRSGGCQVDSLVNVAGISATLGCSPHGMSFVSVPVRVLASRL